MFFLRHLFIVRDIDLHQRSTIRIWLVLLIVWYTCSTIQAGICWAYEVNAVMNHGASTDLVKLLPESAAATWYKAVGNTLLVANMLLAEGFFVSLSKMFGVLNSNIIKTQALIVLGLSFIASNYCYYNISINNN